MCPEPSSTLLSFTFRLINWTLRLALVFCSFQGSIFTKIEAAETWSVNEHTSASKIRAAFFGIGTVEEAEERFALLQRNGFNAALVNDSGYAVKSRLWREWANIAREYDIRLFPIFSFAGTAEIETLRGSFTPYVNRDGIIFTFTPCPLDGTYWERTVAERFSILADLSRLVPLEGILFDTEMYGSDISVYDDFCFCELCWNEFLQMLILSDLFQVQHLEAARFLSAPQRFNYLARYGLQDRYMLFQEERLEELVSRMETFIHHSHPDIPLGFLAFVDNWFYRALIRGLGTPVQPVLVFSETWYVRGYTPLLLQEQANILSLNSRDNFSQGQDPVARYIPGLWQGRFFPEDIPQQIYNLAVHSDGYWMFSADSLWSEKPRTGHYTLHASREDYCLAFRIANAELQKFSEAPNTYQSNLPPVHIASSYDTAQQTLLTQPALNDVFKHLAGKHKGDQLQTTVDFRDTALFHCMNVSKKGRLSISSLSSQHSYNRLSYTIFDRYGKPQDSEELQDASQTVVIESSSLPAGGYSLLISSKNNANRFSFEGSSCVIEASGTFPFSPSKLPQKYGVYIPGEKKQIKLRMYSPGKQKKAVITMQSPDRQLETSVDVVEFTETRIPLSSRRQQSFFKQENQLLREWSITLQAVSDRTPYLLLYFYDEPFPYLLISPFNVEHSADKDL